MLMQTHLSNLEQNLDQFVTNLFIGEHVYNKYSILKLNDLIWLELCKFVYKNGYFPVSVKYLLT